MNEATQPAKPPITEWKDGIHKEPGGETFYYTKERRFVLRTVDDDVGCVPVWCYEGKRAANVPPVSRALEIHPLTPPSPELLAMLEDIRSLPFHPHNP